MYNVLQGTAETHSYIYIGLRAPFFQHVKEIPPLPPPKSQAAF